MGVPLKRDSGAKSVIAGLDPAIHPLRKILLKMDGCAGLRPAEAASAAQAGQARA
jgi:hypothetical protein